MEGRAGAGLRRKQNQAVMQAFREPQPTVRVAMKQKWPIRVGLHVQENLTLSKGHILPATEAMPERLSTAGGWRIKSFLTGGLDGESVCPPHLVFCSGNAPLFQFTWVIFFCSSVARAQCNSHFFRRGIPRFPSMMSFCQTRHIALVPSCNSYYT